VVILLRLVTWVLLLVGAAAFVAALAAATLLTVERDVPLLSTDPEWWMVAVAGIGGLTVFASGVWLSEYVADRLLRSPR